MFESVFARGAQVGRGSLADYRAEATEFTAYSELTHSVAVRALTDSDG